MGAVVTMLRFTPKKAGVDAALKGSHSLLAWFRSKADTWQAVLRDDTPPPLLTRLRFALDLPAAPRSTRIFSFWPAEERDVSLATADGEIHIHNLRYGAMARIDC